MKNIVYIILFIPTLLFCQIGSPDASKQLRNLTGDNVDTTNPYGGTNTTQASVDSLYANQITLDDLGADSSLMTVLPTNSITIDGLGNTLTLSNTNFDFGFSGDTRIYGFDGVGVTIQANDGITMAANSGGFSVTGDSEVTFNNNNNINFSGNPLTGVPAGTIGTHAVNKNQLDSLITAFQEVTDSTSITVNLEGKHNKIVRIDMTGVSNAGTITLQSPLNPYSSATEVGVYTFHIINGNAHNFDFPANFLDVAGDPYDASSTIEISTRMVTAYYDGTNYYVQ